MNELVETGLHVQVAVTSFLFDLLLSGFLVVVPSVPTDVLGLGTGLGEPDPPSGSAALWLPALK